MSGSNYRHHPYLLLTAFMVDTQFYRVGKTLGNSDCYTRNRVAFQKACRNYQERIEEYLRQYRAMNGTVDTVEHHLAPHCLYSPGFALAYGHTDSLGLVLVDDINSFFAITSELDVASFEHVDLAFCPILGDLVSEDDPVRSQLKEPHEIFAPDGFSVSSPLLTVTRLKVSGLLTLGPGLLAQRGLIKAIICAVKRTNQELTRLRKRVKLYSNDDVTQSWISIVDSQGPSELSVIIGTTNYTVGASLA